MTVTPSCRSGLWSRFFNGRDKERQSQPAAAPTGWKGGQRRGGSAAPVGCLLLLFFLAGCQVAPVKAPEPTGEGSLGEHAAAVRALAGWELAGRAAINTAREAGTVSLSWRQRDEHYVVSLRAPWGAGSVRVEGDPSGVMLTAGGGVQEFASEPRELLARYTGLDLPLESLRYWLLGLPDPAASARPEVDGRGLLSSLRQHGWRIEYLRYGDFNGLALPTRLFLRAEHEEVEVRVVVQRWELEPRAAGAPGSEVPQ